MVEVGGGVGGAPGTEQDGKIEDIDLAVVVEVPNFAGRCGRGRRGRGARDNAGDLVVIDDAGQGIGGANVVVETRAVIMRHGRVMPNHGSAGANGQNRV